MAAVMDKDIQQMRKQVAQKLAIREATDQAAMKARIAGNWLPLAGSDAFNLNPEKKSDANYWFNRSDSVMRTAKNLSYDTGSSGGFTVPDGSTFDEMFEVGLVQGDPLRREATVITDGMLANSSVPVAVDNGAQGRILQPGATSTRTDPSFALRRTYEHKFASDEIVAPYELWRDGGPKFIASTLRLAGHRISRIQGAKFATGLGIGEPLGFCSQVDLGATSSSQTAPIFDDLWSLIFSVDPMYWDDPTRSPCLMMHSNVLKYFRLLKDGQGLPLFDSSGIPKFTRIVVNNFCPSTMTAGQRIAWFGDFKACVMIHETDSRIVRYNETFAESDSGAIEAFQSADSWVLDAQAVKALQLSN